MSGRALVVRRRGRRYVVCGALLAALLGGCGSQPAPPPEPRPDPAEQPPRAEPRPGGGPGGSAETEQPPNAQPRPEPGGESPQTGSGDSPSPAQLEALGLSIAEERLGISADRSETMARVSNRDATWSVVTGFDTAGDPWAVWLRGGDEPQLVVAGERVAERPPGAPCDLAPFSEPLC